MVHVPTNASPRIGDVEGDVDEAKDDDEDEGEDEGEEGIGVMQVRANCTSGC